MNMKLLSTAIVGAFFALSLAVVPVRAMADNHEGHGDKKEAPKGDHKDDHGDHEDHSGHE